MDPYVGEIRLFAGTYNPNQWKLCDGSLLPISQFSTLYSVIGAQYGGNGTTNFALPDLRGKAPIHQGQGPGLTLRDVGETGGESGVALQVTEMPAHIHVPQATTVAAGGVADPTGAVWGSETSFGTKPYASPVTNGVAMNPQALGSTGGSQPHNNMQPYLGLTFIICYNGIFPARP